MNTIAATMFEEKLSFLKMINIIPVCVSKQIFNDKIWDTEKEIITLPEVEK